MTHGEVSITRSDPPSGPPTLFALLRIIIVLWNMLSPARYVEMSPPLQDISPARNVGLKPQLRDIQNDTW